MPPDDRYFVVDVGDSLMYLSEGRAVATKHRVVNPPADRLFGSSRTSIAFFHLPNYDCPLEPVTSDRVDRSLGQFAADFDVESLLDADGFVPYYRLIERASERGFNA